MTSLELIHRACRTGSLDSVRKLLEAQPTLIDTVDAELGWTPLYRAVMCGHVAIVQELLGRGADPNRLNKLGEAPLHQAVSVSEEVVNALLDSGAAIDIRQLDGETPLHIAAAKGYERMVRLLLRRNATVDLPNFTYGKTALHLAAEGGSDSVVVQLLRAGACIDIRDKNGRTPEDCAETSAIKEMLRTSPLTPPKPQVLLKAKCSAKPSSFRILDLEEGTQSTASYLKTLDPEPVHLNSAQQNTCDSETIRYNQSADVSGAYSSRGAKQLLEWLVKHRLEAAYRVLVENGYDDLEILQETQRSEVPLTKEMLRNIGLMKPGLAARLLGLIELETLQSVSGSFKETERLNCCSRPVIYDTPSYPSLELWLARMNLEHLYENFVSAGYDDFEHLVLLNKTQHKITDEVLYRELGIKMVGHRHRILFRLMEDSRSSSQASSFVSRAEAEQRCAPCKNCLLW